MNNQEIAVLAEFTFKPEGILQAKKIIAQIKEPSQKEDGCLYYDFFQDSETSNRFIMIERWTNKAVWEAHLKTEHISQAVVAIQPFLLEQIKVQWFTHALIR